MGTKKLVLQQSCYSEFECKGSECDESCCGKWHITIDKKTYFKYKNIKDPEFAYQLPSRVKRIKDASESDYKYAMIILDKDGNCPYLNKNKMCEIQLKYGSKMLCHTCSFYPRSESILLKDLYEVSLYLSCSIAARLVLLNKEQMTFITTEVDKPTFQPRHLYLISNPENEELLEHAWIIRECCIDFLQNRTYSIAERIFVIGMILKRITELNNEKQAKDIPETVNMYKRNMNTGAFNDAFETLKNLDTHSAIQSWLFIAYELPQFLSLKRSSAPFRNLVSNLLNKDKQNFETFTIDNNQISEIINNKAAKHWTNFLSKYNYILENYFVNYVFSKIFPFEFNSSNLSPYDHFILLVEQFSLLKSMLCINCDDETGITEDQLIATVCALEEYSHHTLNKEEAARQITQLKEQKLDSLASLAYILQ